MTCERCSQDQRVAVRRAKVGERDGKVAVVIGVPMEECPACGERWLAFDTARRLDEMLTDLLDGDDEVATRHFDPAEAA